MSFQGRNVGGDHLPKKEGIEDEVREEQEEKKLPGDDKPTGEPVSEAEAEE